MDKEQLGKLAQDVRNLLQKYDIPVEGFVMNILVPEEYYQTIKENFPDRHAMDVIVGSGEENWSIDITRPYVPQGGSYPHEKPK